MTEAAEYTTEVQEAMEMLGSGYDQPSVEITPAHTTIERRGKEFQEVVKPAFVKISTGFKAEMKNIDEVALKVWLYIALSVNRYSGRANPGLRTISRDCNLAVNTVRSAIERLEDQYNLLTVDRESRRYNIYEPLVFVSANRSEPVSGADTPDKSISVDSKSVSVDSESVSARVILNQSNQSNQKTQAQRIEEAKERKAKQKSARDARDPVIEILKGGIDFAPVDALRKRIEKALKMNLEREWDLPKSDWFGYDSELLEREQTTGQTIESFMTWFNSDEFRKKSGVWLKPSKIEQWWPQAFESYSQGDAYTRALAQLAGAN